jgi:hypothetical protein
VSRLSREPVELPGGDVSSLVGRLDGASFVNLQPGVDDAEVPPPSVLGSWFSARGPVVPLATWTPEEIGVQHGAGPKALDRLADAGHPVPDSWRRVADHPKRGLVLRPPPGEDPAVVLRWLVRAAELLCPLEITGPWRATVHRRGER